MTTEWRFVHNRKLVIAEEIARVGDPETGRPVLRDRQGRYWLGEVQADVLRKLLAGPVTPEIAVAEALAILKGVDTAPPTKSLNTLSLAVVAQEVG
ncbi:MAG: hypothetical protein ACPGOY_07065 [Rhodospirillaceae bacterium]